MENASKALIIAGAILLSILIIGLGMAVYNNASSSVGSANMDAQEISAHNSQFLAYEGKVKGTQVKALVQLIKNNNKSNEDKMIYINASYTTADGGSSCFTTSKTGTDDPNDYTAYTSNIKSSTSYFVTFLYDDTGLIGGVEFHVYNDADL